MAALAWWFSLLPVSTLMPYRRLSCLANQRLRWMQGVPLCQDECTIAHSSWAKVKCYFWCVYLCSGGALIGDICWLRSDTDLLYMYQPGACETWEKRQPKSANRKPAQYPNHNQPQRLEPTRLVLQSITTTPPQPKSRHQNGQNEEAAPAEEE